MRIAFTTALPKEGFGRLKAYPNPSLEGRAFLVGEEGWQEADILVSTFDYRVTREMIEGMPNLRLIANFGAGYNNIDLEACRERGIRVTNTPQPVIEPTAELAFALMIDVARRVSEFDRAIRNGSGQPIAVMNNLSHSLYGKTLGILGMGRIGQALARRAVASGMRIIYHNRKPLTSERIKALKSEGVEAHYVDFQTLLQDSD